MSVERALLLQKRPELQSGASGRRCGRSVSNVARSSADVLPLVGGGRAAAKGYDDGRPRSEMKEILTKRFWKEVKKTFHDALQGATPEGSAEPASTADDPK